MNDIIERAAKAIYYGTAGEGDDRKGAWERDTGAGKEGCRDMAKAVFQAIREPTDYMARKGLGGLGEEGGNSVEVWQYMIDAALREYKP